MNAGSYEQLTFRPGVPRPAALELFYDLVFVAVVVVLSHYYSHDSTTSVLVWLVLVFSVIWLTWLQTTLLFNLQRSERHLTRFLVLGQMLCLVLAAVSAADGDYEHSLYVGPVLGLNLLLVALLHWDAARHDPSVRNYARRRIIGNVLAAVLVASTTWWPDGFYVIGVLLAIACLVVPSLKPDPFAGQVRDSEHLVERFGAFTVIMLGESFVKTALTATEDQMVGLDLVCLIATFVVVFAIWWLYFSDIPIAGPPAQHWGHQGWIYAHLPLHLCIVGIAVGTTRVVLYEGEGVAPETVPYLTIPLFGVLLCLAALAVLSAIQPMAAITVAHLIAAAAVGVIGAVAAYVQVDGVEGSSVLLMLVMLVLVAAVTNLRAAHVKAT